MRSFTTCPLLWLHCKSNYLDTNLHITYIYLCILSFHRFIKGFYVDALNWVTGNWLLKAASNNLGVRNWLLKAASNKLGVRNWLLKVASNKLGVGNWLLKVASNNLGVRNWLFESCVRWDRIHATGFTPLCQTSNLFDGWAGMEPIYATDSRHRLKYGVWHAKLR